MKEHDDTAGVVAFPPLIFGAALAAGIVADYLISKRRLPPAAPLLAPACFGAAASLVIPAVGEFKKASTPVDPFEATTALVQSGPFAHTRNPLYLALTLAYSGVALAARASLPLALLPAVLWIVNSGVIEREERYLERKFGEPYREYMRRVPRWF